MMVYHIDAPGEYRAEMLAALIEALSAFRNE